jgi:hypothetical protein
MTPRESCEQFGGTKAIVLACTGFRPATVTGAFGRPVRVQAPSGIVEFNLCWISRDGGDAIISYIVQGKLKVERFDAKNILKVTRLQP